MTYERESDFSVTIYFPFLNALKIQFLDIESQTAFCASLDNAIDMTEVIDD